MRTTGAARILAVALAALLAGPGQAGASGVPVGVHGRVFGATPEQLQLVRWAIGRFEAAGLEAPRVEVHFGEVASCGGHLGYAKGGRVDLCTTLVNATTRRTILHEMGHIWLDQNVGASVRTRFLELRGLSSWNAGSDPWGVRGYEQGAEIMAWALGDRILTPTIPDSEPQRLAAAYELLTGLRLPAAGALD